MSNKKLVFTHTKLGTLKAVVEWVPLAAIVIDEAAQRRVIKAHVSDLARTFDPGALGIIHLSKRADGQLHPVDGMHRVLAARDAGHGQMKVKCHVYSNLSAAQEAVLFLLFNNSRPVSAIDKYRLGLRANDPNVVGTDEIVRSFGLHVGPSADGSIRCVNRLLALHSHDPALLRETLGVAIESWGTDSTSVEDLVLGGLSTVLVRYDGELDKPALVRKLSKFRGGPAGLIGRSRQLAEIKPITKQRAVAEIIVDAYNKGRGSGQVSPL